MSNCKAFCPRCHHDLIRSGSFKSDTDDGVRYTCTTCGLKTLWDFDTPVPILLEEEK
ncbi:nucleic-acid-binding protein [Bacillus phage vB_BcgM]|nr:nucleic-acid-binding protein [Bacillus phage vB_BcgM]